MAVFNKVVHYTTSVIRFLGLKIWQNNTPGQPERQPESISENLGQALAISSTAGDIAIAVNEMEVVNTHGDQLNLIFGHGEPQQPPPVNLTNESTIALGLYTVSAGSLVAILVVVFGEPEIKLAHPVAFQAFTLLTLTSLMSASTMLLLALSNANMSNLVMIMRLTMGVGFGSLSFAYTWAASVILLGNRIGTIAALAFLLVFTVVILGVCFHKKYEIGSLRANLAILYRQVAISEHVPRQLYSGFSGGRSA